MPATKEQKPEPDLAVHFQSKFFAGGYLITPHKGWLLMIQKAASKSDGIEQSALLLYP